MIKDLESLQNKFFLGGSEVEKKMVCVKWDTIMVVFDTEGLGVGNLESFKFSLLQKRQWIFLSKTNQFRRR